MSSANCSFNFHIYYLRHTTNHLWRYIPAVVLAVASTCSIVVNLLLIITLRKYRHLRTASNKILMSLAVSDFLTGSLVGPVTATQLFKFYSEGIHCVLDYGVAFAESLLIGASSGTLALISYDRYLHISLLHNYKMTKLKLYGILVLCWMMPVFNILAFFIHVNVGWAYCILLESAMSVIIFTCYISLIVVLRRHSGHHSRNISVRRRFLKQQRLARMIGIILTTHYMMIAMFGITVAFYIAPADSVTRSKVHLVAASYNVLNSVVNPLVFSYNIPSINRSTKKLLGMKYPVSINSSQSFGPKNCLTIEDKNNALKGQVANVTSTV